MATKKRLTAQKLRKSASAVPEAALFDRVAGIIEQAQGSVVRDVNSGMVLGYWLIGREIVRELQGGRKRAACGQEVLADLSKRLGERYGRGFSVSDLKNFRAFFLSYQHRVPEIRHIGGAVLEHLSEASEQGDAARGFSPNLGWSHYRALMRVENRVERLFYPSEKSGAIARYSVLHESRQIFASTYVFHLPTEQELRREIERERRLIEERAAARNRKTKPSN
jgi:hypothetical protein